MKLLSILLILGSVFTAGMLAGCGSSGDDKALETAAPPPGKDAVPDAPNPNKKRMGEAGASGAPGGAAPGAGGPVSGPMAKPAGE